MIIWSILIEKRSGMSKIAIYKGAIHHTKEGGQPALFLQAVRASVKNAPSRWFLLSGLILIYFLGLKWGVSTKDQSPAGSILLFTFFMTLHISLHWFYLAKRLPQRWPLLYFYVQAALVLPCSMFSSNAVNMLIGLFLVLIGEAIGALRLYVLIPVVISYIAFFVLYIVLQGGWHDFLLTFHNLGFFVIAPLLFVIGYMQVRAHERTQSILRQLEASHREVMTYAMRVEDLTLAAERQRLARELHDTLAQGLSGLVIQLEVVDAHLLKNNVVRAQEIVQQTMSGARDTLAEARHAIDNLRETVLGSEDLVETIQEEIDHFTSATGISCTADLAPLSSVPDLLCEHALRVVKEGLTNITRHARAHRAWVCITRVGAQLTVEVGDDGVGFVLNDIAHKAGHYGLLGLRERARLTGGQLEIVSAPEQGTIVRLHFPLTRGGTDDE